MHLFFWGGYMGEEEEKQRPALQEHYVFRAACRWCNPSVCPLKNIYAKTLKILTCVAFNELIVLYWSKNSCKSSHCFIKVLNLLWIAPFQNWRGEKAPQLITAGRRNQLSGTRSGCQRAAQRATLGTLLGRFGVTATNCWVKSDKIIQPLQF